jgi:starvation-inducible DNA-binding protein
MQDTEMTELKQAMKITFASTFSFYLKAANYHWNVEGPLFPQLHALFDTIYSEVYGSIDRFAEEIRAIGSYTPASLGRFQDLSIIEDEREIVPYETMIENLLADNAKLMEALKLAYDLAEREGAHGLSNFLAERMDAHRKHGWMLRATSKQ